MDEDEVFEGESGSLCKVQASMAPRLTLSLSAGPPSDDDEEEEDDEEANDDDANQEESDEEEDDEDMGDLSDEGDPMELLKNGACHPTPLASATTLGPPSLNPYLGPLVVPPQCPARSNAVLIVSVAC